MQNNLELQFKTLIEAGNKKHGSPWVCHKNGILTYSEYMLLSKSIRENKYTLASIIHAATYAGRKSITIKLQ
jgi:hypothetical protein